MKQDSAHIFEKHTRFFSHPDKIEEMNKVPSGELIGYETDLDKTLSNNQNQTKFLGKRNISALHSLSSSSYTSKRENSLSTLLRPAKMDDKRESKCVIHSDYNAQEDNENRYSKNDAFLVNYCQEHPDRIFLKPQTLSISNHDYSYTNNASVDNPSDLSVAAKYVNLHEESISHNMFSVKEDNSIGGKGDFFTELDLVRLGYFAEEIKWDNLKAPDRRELHPMMHDRLCSFINPDIVLLIDDHEFYCHRIVLQCYSSYFDELNNLEPKNYIKLEKSISKEAFIAIYAWMLTIGQGGFHYLSRENILEVLIACQLLKVSDLEEQCLAFIDNEQAFSEENAFHLFMDASKLKNKPIMELMIPRIRAFFLHLVSSKEFLELKVDDLCTFLHSNYAIIHCEMEIFMSAVRWLMYNWDERCNYLTVVMRCVRFGLMIPSQLVDIRKNPESPEFLKVTQDKTVQKMIDDGMAYSVENSLTGDKADHVHRCNLLKLDIPEPRNFSKEIKDYKTYSEFLNFLQELHKNPKYMVLKNKREAKFNSADDYLIQTSAYSQDSLSTERALQSLDTNLENRNKHSLQLQTLYESDKREIGIKKIEEYGHKLFLECIDSSGNKFYKPVAYHHESETLKTLHFDNNNNNELNDKNIINKYDIIHEDKYKTDINRNDIKLCGYPDEKFCRKKIIEQDRKPKLKMSLRDNAATIIQSIYRGYRVRNYLRKRFRQLSEVDTSKAAHAGQETTILQRTNTNISHFSSLRRSRSSDSNMASLKTNYNVPGSLYFSHHPSILIFGGKNPGYLNELSNSCTVYRYVPDNNNWETVSLLPKPRYHHSTTMLRGRIYVVGGCCPLINDSNINIYDENWSFEPLTKQWSLEEKLLTPRKSCGLVTFHGYMYAIGGLDNDNNILASVERYDLSIRKWEEITPLPEPLIYPAVCVHKNNIWVAGGLNSYPKPVVSSNVYCYDPIKNLWSKSAQLRFARGFSSLINYDDTLHLVGGAIVKNNEVISLDSIDIWDEKQEKWKLKATMAIPRHGHVVALFGDQMLMIGGSTTKYVKSLNQVDAWCMKTGSWNRHICSLPVPVVGHSIITLPPSTHI